MTLAHAGACVSVGQAKTSPDGATVSAAGSITQLESTDCYIESTDRSSGIWVQADTTGLAIGDIVTATGTLATVNGERVIQDAALGSTGSRSVIQPFGLRNAWLGGLAHADTASLQDYIPYVLPSGGVGYKWQVVGGAPNTGVLTKTWGTVNAVYYSPVTTAHWFYVDDGSGVVSDFGDQGIIVYSDANVQEGDSVTVTGVSSIETALDGPARLVRTIRPRSASDVVVVKRVPFVPTYPFSDEFDSAILDSRWITTSDVSMLSLTANPGWITLYALGWGTSNSGYGLSIWQSLSGDWDIDIKLRPQFSVTPTSQAILVDMSDKLDDSYFHQICYRLMSVGYSTTTNATYVQLAGTSAPVANSDTYWLRARMRGGTLYASVSLDGTSYSAESSINMQHRYMLIRAFTNGIEPYRPMIDYFRFTRL